MERRPISMSWHVQNNRLTGTLDVLRDLPLKDVNVENNQFAGSIPEKMLNIPKFLRNGNHLTIPIPGSSPTPATSSPSPAVHPHITVCMRSTSDLIQSCERFQKRGHGFAEEGTSKKKLATSPSSSSMAGRQASLSSSDLMLSCEGFQKHGYEFPTTHVSHRLLYTTGAESCPSDNGNATAAKDSLSNNVNLKNDDSLGNVLGYDDFLPLEDDSVDTLTHDDGIGIVQRVS
ncbi:Protein STRUBBELIG-RECEPTOR FAMILY 8 [Hordeum vulgare]|nr:Protein STRUBBELIG-RECEPTOR FAMILY 8 [Hordeum vulgare]